MYVFPVALLPWISPNIETHFVLENIASAALRVMIHSMLGFLKETDDLFPVFSYVINILVIIKFYFYR